MARAALPTLLLLTLCALLTTGAPVFPVAPKAPSSRVADIAPVHDARVSVTERGMLPPSIAIIVLSAGLSVPSGVTYMYPILYPRLESRNRQQTRVLSKV